MRTKEVVIFWYFIIICKTDDLCDEDFLVLFNPKLLGGKRIDAVTISDEFQSLAREFFKFIKCHPHGKDAGADISGSRDLIFENREGHLVHDEPDIGFNAFDLYVGFIGSQFIGRAAGHDRFHGFAVTEALKLPVLFDKKFDDRKLIGKEHLVFWTVEFIMSPLLQRDVSADKENKPADLEMLSLNDSK